MSYKAKRFVNILRQSVLAYLGAFFLSRNHSVEPNTLLLGERHSAKPWGQDGQEGTCPQSVYIVLRKTAFLTLDFTLLKGVIRNHDIKYRRNRDWEWWSLLPGLRQVCEGVSWRNQQWQRTNHQLQRSPSHSPALALGDALQTQPMIPRSWPIPTPPPLGRSALWYSISVNPDRNADRGCVGRKKIMLIYSLPHGYVNSPTPYRAWQSWTS